MPDGLGVHGIVLHAEYEAGPDGDFATEAYECSGGRYTLGGGATTWPLVPPATEGRPIQKGEFCTPEQAIELTNWALRFKAETVDRVIRQPMTVNQRDAFILLCFNIGEHAFEFECTAVKLFNERPLLPGREDDSRREQIAAAFGRWCKATNNKPDRSDIGKPYYDPIIGRNEAGQVCWVDQNGKQCYYQKAMPGLLRRHLAEACLFLSLDWRQACRKDTVSIVSNRIWDTNDKRWEDIVRTKTELSDILPIAKGYPLPEPAHSDQPVPAPQPAADAKPSPAATQDSSTLVLTKDTQAAPAAKPDVAGAAPSPPNPSVAAPAPVSKPQPEKLPSVDQVGVSASAAAPPEHPVPRVTDKPPPVAPKPPVPPVVAGQDGAKPKSPWTVQPEDVHYKIDPGAGLKPLEDSDRARAFYWQRTFMGVIYLGGAGVFGNTFRGGSEVLMKHAALMSVFLDLAVPLALSITALVLGAVGKSWADWRRHHAQQVASQGLY